MRYTSLFVLAALAFGCARSPDLEPAASADRVVGMDDAAVAFSSGVQVIVQADEWPEQRAVPRRVTPVLVDIINRGDRSLRIEYRHFVLQTQDARVLAALPPFRVYGTPTEPRVAGRAMELSYDAEGFEVAPFYSEIYTDLPRYRRPFVADQRYYGTNYAQWERVGGQLPTRTMQVMALPEGVLRPDGHVTGYLYFEKVPADAGRVYFRFNLVDAETGRIFQRIEVPFVQG